MMNLAQKTQNRQFNFPKIPNTGHTSRQYLSAHISAEEKHQQLKTSKEDIKQDVETPYPTADTSAEMTLTQSE